MPRKTYTREFKLQALRMLSDQGLSVAGVARRLGVGEDCLRNWRAAAQQMGEAAFPGQGNPSPAEDEPRRPRRGAPSQGGEGPAKKGRRVLRQPAEPTLRFIAGQRDGRPISWACDALGASEAGYHAWASRPPSPAELRRGQLVGAIEATHAEVKGRDGSPRMTAELTARGLRCTGDAVASRMKTHGIRARTTKRLVKTTGSRHSLPVADTILDRDFALAGPNPSWGAGLTYTPTADGGPCLAVVEDRFSRKIVGWPMDSTTASRLVVDALDMAARRRTPEEGLLAHPDRGRQYASAHYQRLLGKHGVTCSMSGVARCWDNAPVESFFASLKKEVVHHESCTGREEAKASIFEYIEAFYNRARRHSSLGFLSPQEFERSHNQNQH